MSESALFEGTLRHRRLIEPAKAFTYPLFMVYLDLSELETVFDGHPLWSTSKPNLAWFRRADHHGELHTALDTSTRDVVEARTGRRPVGPIRLLTHLRYFGHCFNPVSFFYCFGEDGRTLETVVAEVNSTPWNERHLYVLSEDENRGDRRSKRYHLKKEFHVSPFLGMAAEYDWRFGPPPQEEDGRLWVRMESREAERPIFEATLSLQRRPIDARQLARALSLYPAMTVQVFGAIYRQAFELWLRRAPFFPHPRTENVRP